MGITSSETQTILSHIQGIAYAHSEEDYQRIYEDLCNVMNHQCRQYFMRNWDNIREQWVEGLKSCQTNLCTRTNNCTESFFAKFKCFCRGNLKELIAELMSTLPQLGMKKRYRMTQETATVSTKPESTETEGCYKRNVTPYAFKYLQAQFQSM